VRAITNYYKANIAPGSAVLDICSSWVSHYPADFPHTMERISATGMNALELGANAQLSDFEPKNLNLDPSLPYDDASFDVVTCVVSVDYLIRPLEVFREVHRVLRPGGKFILSQSNRCFPSKAIGMWLGQSDLQHCLVIAAYFHYAKGWQPARIFDASPTGPNTNDPLFMVEATKGEPKPLDASRWLKKK
jgi:SAM-dependent methyltransferase